MSDAIFNREEILGDAAKGYSFDKVLRGYDIKQVDDYIENLVKTHKNASEIFDSRFNDLKNKNTMLNYELEQVKSELETSMKTINSLRAENDRLTKGTAGKNDKNGSESDGLSGQLDTEVGSDKSFYEISQIYESTIDKAEDLISRLQNEFSLAHSKAEDIKKKEEK